MSRSDDIRNLPNLYEDEAEECDCLFIDHLANATGVAATSGAWCKRHKMASATYEMIADAIADEYARAERLEEENAKLFRLVGVLLAVRDRDAPFTFEMGEDGKFYAVSLEDLLAEVGIIMHEEADNASTDGCASWESRCHERQD